MVMKVTRYPVNNTTNGGEVADKPAATTTSAEKKTKASKKKEPQVTIQDGVDKAHPSRLEQLKTKAFETGVLRQGMDNICGTQAGNIVGKSTDTPQEAKALFDQRLKAAQEFLTARGMEGRVIAKFVSADKLTVMRIPVVEHAEWQFFLIPRNDLDKIPAKKHGVIFMGHNPHKELPGFLDENKLNDWVKKETGAEGFLRSHDNPLFLGRMNLGEGGAGMYDGVPEYAEIGGQRFNTRELKGIVLVEPDEVHAAIDYVYNKLPGEWGEKGVCHQGAVATGHGLGLDPREDVAWNIKGLWITRFKFGREGKD